MSNKTYAVIGCGWLGLPVAEKWVNENKKVIGTTTSENKIELLKSKEIEAHLLKDEVDDQTKIYLKEVDLLLLCIPPSSLKEKYANFLLAIIKELKSSAKTIMISSTSVYGDNNQIADEESPLDGNGLNSAFIIEAEQKLKEYAKEKITILRMSGLVGKDRNPAKYMQGRTISGGNEPVNLIHLEDCIRIIQHVIDMKIWDETINASATEHPTKKDFYSYSAKKLNLKEPQFDMKEQKSKKIDNSKLVKNYGYKYFYPNPYNFPY